MKDRDKLLTDMFEHLKKDIEELIKLLQEWYTTLPNDIKKELKDDRHAKR